MQGILRVAMAVPHLALGDVRKNTAAHIEMLRKAKEHGVHYLLIDDVYDVDFALDDA